MANEIVKKKKSGIASYLNDEAVRQSVINAVGEKDIQRFVASVVSATQTNPSIAECTNSSILSVALVGHSLNLPPSPQMGFFYFVPYDSKKKDANGNEYKVKECQFQLSYKGYLQLALRTGEYKKIHVTSIKEGELKSYDPIEDEYTFEPILDYETREKAKTIGYYAFFVLNNGNRKELYWSREKMENHARKYSASYRSTKKWVHDNSLWSTDFDSMAFKTLIRQLISRWGIMSTEMATAYQSDMAVLDEDGNPDYVDNVPDDPEPAVDVTTDIVVDAEVVDAETH